MIFAEQSYYLKLNKQTNMQWTVIKKSAYKLLTPIVKLLARLGFTPNGVSTLGFLLTIIAAGILVVGGYIGIRGDYHYIMWFGFMVLFAGMFDMLDGHLARLTNKSTTFGAFYDSVLDRYSELVMFLGICYYLASHHFFLSSIFAFIAMIGSIMVSYIRARAEALDIECKVGLMQRPERILTIGISAILYGLIYYFVGEFKWTSDIFPFVYIENISVFCIPIFILAILTNYTAFQRLNYCRKQMK